MRRLPADLLTPLGALMRLRAGPSQDAFLFESVERGERVGRYSYVGVAPVEAGALDAEEFRARARAVPGPREGPEPAGPAAALPRFLGGLVFALGWDYARALEPRLGRPRGPVARAALFREIVAFDHLKQELHLVAGTEPALDALQERLDAPFCGLQASGFRLRAVGPGARSPEPGARSPPRPNLDCAGFARVVARAKEYIFAGDAFQIVLSRRFEVETRASGLAIYRALRTVNPSPYMFYLSIDGTEWAGASPEMLIRVEDGRGRGAGDGREVVTHPIAGTRRRGAGEAEDAALGEELRADPKERAEHAMLVDLARNDLGRICAGGTVRIARHMEVERFSHVMHLVSEVRGRLRADVDAVEALEACFPAGTVSGAPKVRAMEIIDELEPAPRGLYAGAVGALSFSGALDSCIAIRMIEVANGVATWQAGAGVVAASSPEREAEETREKAMAMASAIRRAEEEGL